MFEILCLAPARLHDGDVRGGRAADPAQVWDDQAIVLTESGQIAEVVGMSPRATGQHDPSMSVGGGAAADDRSHHHRDIADKARADQACVERATGLNGDGLNPQVGKRAEQAVEVDRLSLR